MLSDGPNTLAQNTVYAMPGKSKMVLSKDVLQVCGGTTGGTYTAVAATTTSGAVLPGACFVKCTAATTSCVLTNQ
jgi:hypothetical protein